MQNYYEYLEHYSNLSRVAIFDANGKISFKELKTHVDKMIAFLQNQGVKSGDNVAFIMSNCKEFMILYFAIASLKAVAVPINTMLKCEEYEYIIKDCDAKLLIVSKDIKEAAELANEFKDILIYHSFDDNLKDGYLASYLDYAPVYNFKCEASIDDSVHIIYTSGTTGLPKGVLLSYKNILSNIKSAQHDFKIKSSDRAIAYLPMFHSFTLTAVCLLPLLSGCSLVIERSVLPFSNVIKQILLKRVTILFSVPVILNALLKAKLPWYFMWFHKIRIIVSGSSALSEGTLKAYKEKFKRTAVLEGYGLSECSPVVAVNRLDKQKVNSVGLPLHGYQVKVVDDDLKELPIGEVGELIVKGDCVMQGYYNKPELTNEVIEGEWLKTGDIARLDEDGFIYIVDRKKDIIIAKGMNIYPREIEDIIMQLDEVDSCAVIGVKDSELDESVVAYVCLKEGATLNAQEIQKYLKKYLANYKVPKTIIFKCELPKNAAGKVLKKELKKELEIGKN
ncbi:MULTISPECIES: long-chain-fatty-acid--CoA ligase [unclassified Campylobacter]|uniref:long-chain-fatty-acid--CoA ligase n=1 Tax=unclassified Campylobacter TaxID=2593542 RepID=UPI001BD987D8|nr:MULTISPECIES: long-chain-fatty-acid--CoA ligase [unclassified Campylobacter]MBT0879912.1 long-chain-fatty-acid--CoA ligase [Campylobacter sp. 2018MI27]MBT0884305.1 long-chain-fatty-acid--CoA ligase [Campylobacter sp. 2018MI10]